MLKGESTVTLIKMAATLALLVFGLRLSAPVPTTVGPIPVDWPDQGMQVIELGAHSRDCGNPMQDNAVYLEEQVAIGSLGIWM